MIDLNQITDRIYANKLAKGFNASNIEREFNFTYAELAEAYDSYRKGRGDVGEELADVTIYVLSLARMLGVDLEIELHTKLHKNEHREYTKVDGRNVRTKEAESMPHAHHPEPRTGPRPLNQPRPRLKQSQPGDRHE